MDMNQACGGEWMRDGWDLGSNEIEDIAQSQMEFATRLLDVLPAPAVSKAFELYERFVDLRLKHGQTWCSFEEFINRIFARGIVEVHGILSAAEAIQKKIENLE